MLGNLLPEEFVRRKFIQFLVHKKGVPLSLITKEKALSELPHLKGVAVPSRRLDLLVYFEKKGDLLPLLLVECKAGKPLYPFTSQLIGYNYFVRAPFCCLVNETQMLFSMDGTFKEVKDLPDYQELLPYP